jgi:hypothetical protein
MHEAGEALETDRSRNWKGRIEIAKFAGRFVSRRSGSNLGLSGDRILIARDPALSDAGRREELRLAAAGASQLSIRQVRGRKAQPRIATDRSSCPQPLWLLGTLPAHTSNRGEKMPSLRPLG